MPAQDDFGTQPSAAWSPEVPELSVVVPALNEAGRLPGSVERLRGFLAGYESAEVILVVDEGSVDDTVKLAHCLADQDPRMRVVHVEPVGKGFAVARGAREARGRVVLLADADLSVDPAEFGRLAAAARDSVAIASRSAPGARRVGEPRSRFLLGRAFNLVVRVLVLPGVRDSQCGFKAFPKAAAEDLLDRQLATGWVFDVELLARARKQDLEIREVPVEWRYGHESTLRPVRDAARIVSELWKVFRRYGRVRARDQ